MPCYHPREAYRMIGSKAKPRFDEYGLLRIGQGFQPDFELLAIPCGKCIGCLLRRSQEWAMRCSHELRYHPLSCFLTLTYDREHLPADRNLDPRHLQLFFKKVRHLTTRKLKYFACGEYGDRRGRPHYHVLLFGHDFLDKELTKNNDGAAYPLYKSAQLDTTWGLGNTTLGTVTTDSADYVARYTLKKAYGSNKPANVVQPFARMSKGIGAQFYDDFSSDMYPSDYLFNDRTMTKRTIPRYYDKRLQAIHPPMLAPPASFEAVKEARRARLDPDRSEYEGLRLRTKEELRILATKQLARRYDNEPQPQENTCSVR